MLTREKVSIKWNKANKKYYQQLGYTFTKYGNIFDVLIQDLPPFSSVKVAAVCDFCKKEYDIAWCHYLEVEKKNQKHACYGCRHIKRYENDLNERQSKLYLKAIEVCKQKGYILLSDKCEFLCNTSYIKYLCPIHGEHKTKVSNLISGKGCPDCVALNNSERFRLSADEVEKRVQQSGGRLLNKDCYVNQTEKNLLVECFECVRPFLTSLRNFTQHGGQVCPECFGIKSVGENKIRQYLHSNNISFISQKWFSDCRDRNPLPFDFYLVDFNTIIEFDGRQHFEEIKYFSYPLDVIQKHDNIKNNYCSEKGIFLIRIPYWDINNIDKILNKKLILHEDIV